MSYFRSPDARSLERSWLVISSMLGKYLTRSIALRAFSARLVLAVIILPGVWAKAQYAPAGITQWSTQIQAGPFSIDMATGAMVMIVPVRNKSGSPNFTFGLVDNFGNMGAVNSNLSFSGNMTTGGFGAYSSVSHPNLSSCGTLGQPNYSLYIPSSSYYFFYDGTGAKHTFFSSTAIRQGPSCGSLGPVTIAANDGSGYTIVVTGGATTSTPISIALYNHDGLVHTGGVTDPDGNTVLPTNYTTSGNLYSHSWQDSLGQTALTESDTIVSNNGVLTTTGSEFSYTDQSGNPQSYVVSYTLQSVETAFTCTQNGASLDVAPTSMYLPASITLPTGGSYAFSYESTPGHSGYVTGRPAKVTLPSGGYVAFVYGNGQFGGTNSIAGYNCVAGTIPSLQVSVNDGNGHTSTTSYQNNANSQYVVGYGVAWVNGPGNYTITETDSLSDVTTHYFYNELEEERAVSDVNNGVLQTTVTCYNGNFTNCATAAYGQTMGVVTQKDVYTYIGSSAPSLIETKYDLYGNTTQISRYDVGAAFPPSGAPLSTTTTAYDTSGACGTLSLPYIYDRPCSIITTNASGATVAQTKYTYSSTGHPTQTSMLVAGSTYISTAANYNSNGTVASVSDGNGNTTSYSYGNCNGLLLTATTFPAINGISQGTSEAWDCNGAVVTSSKDLNNNTTTYSYADPLWRQTGVAYPDGGGQTTSYATGSSLPWTISTNLEISSSSSLTTTTTYDGLDRVVQLETSDPSGVDSVETTYDLLGRVWTVSNPHRSTTSPTDGSTTYTYDALNRTIHVSEPGGATLSNSYSNNCTFASDENNNTREECHDGLSRLTGVWEDPGSSPHLNYETDYSYDALSNLLSVTQWGGPNGSPGARIRSFTYDGLSRLVSGANPESGTIGYQYDGNGNLILKTAPQPNQTGSATVAINYSYDALNRLLSKTYTNAPAGTLSNCYQYDIANKGIGRLAFEWTQPGSCASSPPANYQSLRAIGAYDAMGRELTEQQCAAGYCTSASLPSIPQANCATLSSAAGLQYCYDFAGNLLAFGNGVTTQTAGSFPQHAILFSQTFDAANRLATVASSWNDPTHPSPLFSDPTYTPNKGLSTWLFGSSLWTARQYDNRLRVCNQQSAQQQISAPQCQ